MEIKMIKHGYKVCLANNTPFGTLSDKKFVNGVLTHHGYERIVDLKEGIAFVQVANIRITNNSNGLSLVSLRSLEDDGSVIEDTITATPHVTVEVWNNRLLKSVGQRIVARVIAPNVQVTFECTFFETVIRKEPYRELSITLPLMKRLYPRLISDDRTRN